MGRKRTASQVKHEERPIKKEEMEEENTTNTSDDEETHEHIHKKHKIDFEKEYNELSVRYDRLKKKSYILLENSAKLENVHKDSQKVLKEENASLLSRINSMAEELRKRSQLEHEYQTQKAQFLQASKVVQDLEKENKRLKEENEAQKKLQKELQEKQIRTRDLLQFQNSLIGSSVVHVSGETPIADELEMLNLDVEASSEEKEMLQDYKYMCTLELQNGSILELIMCPSEKDGFVDILVRSFFKMVDDKREELERSKLPFPQSQKTISVEDTEISTFIGSILSWAARSNPL